MIARAWLVALSVLMLGAGAPGGVPGDSLYQLHVPLVTHAGTAAGLDLHRGQLTIVSMFYASCPNVCPMLVAKIGHVDRQLGEASRKQLRVLLVSLDPGRDTPEALRALAQRHHIDEARWTFAQAPEADVRKLAAALGVRYRQLPGSEFNHSTVIALLDAEGRVLRKTSSLAADDREFMDAVRTAAAAQRLSRRE